MRNREHAALPPSVCWIFFWPLVVLGLLAEDVFYALFFPPRGPSMLSALKASSLLSPVAGPWSAAHPAPCIDDAAAITPAGVTLFDADVSYALDLALLKPSCCDAPAGLCHFWDLPRRLGAILAAHAPRPALACHPGQGCKPYPGSSHKAFPDMGETPDRLGVRGDISKWISTSRASNVWLGRNMKLCICAHGQSPFWGRPPRGRPDRPGHSRALCSPSLQTPGHKRGPALMRRDAVASWSLKRQNPQAPDRASRDSL